MSLRFQHRVSLFPGVRLNFSASGISTTIGVPGASVTLGGKQSPHANLGIPGSGLSLRVPLGSRGRSDDRSPSPLPSLGVPVRPSPAPNITAQPRMTALRSSSIDELTTEGLASFHDLILEARRERSLAERAVQESNRTVEQLSSSVLSEKSKVEQTEQTVARKEASFFRFFMRGSIAAARASLEQTRTRLSEAESRLESARGLLAKAEKHRDELWVDTEFRLPSHAAAAWEAVKAAFEKLTQSEAIWDVTAFRGKRTGEERSIATRVIDRKPIRLSLDTLPVIETRYSALRWHNANGADLYLYPGVIIVFQDEDTFAMLDLENVQSEFTAVKFQEQEKLPRDADRVGTTWTYTNKDGTPDRRYGVNPEIPVLLYGETHWKSQTGLNESFQFSNAKAAAVFIDALTDFRTALREG
jgi:Protein of unknown function (DUF4236)